jgi:DNA repair photolyase
MFYPVGPSSRAGGTMRWDNLAIQDQLDGTDPAAPTAGRIPLPLFQQGAVVRTFATPEFRGITFYEVNAKSIINRVPAVSHMPFRWTINPYRGCSHACAYCIWGDARILMADGRTKRLADVRVGDRVYGTVREGSYRRYVATEVLAHWSTVKPAYRVTLEDGTELVASGDHRFLTDRGWKHVTGRGQGRGQRPFLTTNNELLGIGAGALADPPKDSPDYRQGYLTGMIRGDAHLGSHEYIRSNGRPGVIHQFRLALADLEALQRTREYLSDLGVQTGEFLFHAAGVRTRELRAIRTQARGSVDAIREIVAWPADPSEEWAKGFLAGIFDAEGSHGECVRISNTDAEIVAHVSESLDRLGFSFVAEPGRTAGRRLPLVCVRLLGGLRERLRFFQTVDPAITRKRRIREGTAIKSDARLGVVGVEDLGMSIPMYDITTGTGDFIAEGVVSHNCFARKTHTYLDLDAGEDFNSQIVVKVNAPELLRTELARASWAGEHIAMGTNVDPYQRAEGRYRLMRGILEALRDAGNPFSILTKGSLILRDLDLLQECAELTDVGANVSVGFVDRGVWRSLEPGTPSPQKRLQVCRTLNDAGIGCGVLMAPIIPFLTDSPSQLAATVRAIADAGARHVSPIVLHLRPGAREWFLAWLAEHHPDFVPKYERLYAGRAYAPAAYQNEVCGRVHDLARRFGIGRLRPDDVRRGSRRATLPARPPAPEQLGLL